MLSIYSDVNSFKHTYKHLIFSQQCAELSCLQARWDRRSRLSTWPCWGPLHPETASDSQQQAGSHWAKHNCFTEEKWQRCVTKFGLLGSWMAVLLPLETLEEVERESKQTSQGMHGPEHTPWHSQILASYRGSHLCQSSLFTTISSVLRHTS